MQRIYLDNAATTSLAPEVLEAMMPVFTEQFGNPSSIHAEGRKARTLIEKARKTIATLLNAAPAEIFFTSGGTEADNTAIRCVIEAKEIQHAISSRIEHHAVLHTLENLQKSNKIQLHFVDLDAQGHINLVHLEELLKKHPKSLVSLMHGNNEVGNLLNLQRVGELCEQYGAVFHSDTVQTMGHYKHDLQTIKADFIVGAAHKFHGPKGVGFLYSSGKTRIQPFIHGGSQERNMRGGTENIYAIVGMAKALEIAYKEMGSHQNYIQGLKSYMIDKLRENIEGVAFNGDSANLEQSLYTVLSVSLPPSDDNDMLLFNLDIAGISASGGSACSSGTDVGSHVLGALGLAPNRGNVRFSFGKYNTKVEIDHVVQVLQGFYTK